MVDFRKLGDRAKELVEKRGGTDALKQDAAELKEIAKGKGSLSDKAKAAAEALKRPGGAAGAAGTETEATTPKPAPAEPTEPASAAAERAERKERRAERRNERAEHRQGGGDAA